jgi:hypothetical protein
MLSFLIIAEIVFVIGAIILGVISGAIVTVLLRLHAEGIWKDMLLGIFGFEIIRLWQALGDFVISLLGLDTLVKTRIDQFIIAGALGAVTLPALRHVVRFARQRFAQT